MTPDKTTSAEEMQKILNGLKEEAEYKVRTYSSENGTGNHAEGRRMLEVLVYICSLEAENSRMRMRLEDGCCFNGHQCFQCIAGKYRKEKTELEEDNKRMAAALRKRYQDDRDTLNSSLSQ